jgi:site-specific DNA recombinase
MGIYTFNLRLEKSVSGSRNPQFKPQEEWICVDGGMPKIIDDETFNKVQAKLADNKKNSGRYKTRRIYLLTGLIRCGECGSAMYGKSHIDGRHGREYLSYACSGRKYKKICHNQEIRKEYIESYVLKQLQVNLFSEHSIKKLSSMLSDYNKRLKEKSDTEYNSAMQDLGEINKKIEKIIQLVSESGISIDTVKEELKRLEDRKRQAESCIQEIQGQNSAPVLSEAMLTEVIHRTKDTLNTGNLAELRSVIEHYIDSVIVWNDKVEVRFKINIPDEESDALFPLTTEGKLAELRADYKKTVSLGALA